SAAVEMCGGIHCGWITALYVHGRSDLNDAQVHGQEDHVGPGFFSTIGIPMLRGRDFSASDTDKTQRVAIISRAYARQLFGDGDPIGQWVGYEPAPNDHKFLIVGEAADARQLSHAVRQALYEVDPSLPVSEVVPLAAELDGDLGTETLLARLAGI